ncbi:C6 finger domain protein [Beauveria brongniartii RCEF 3172]|uniref:C6 finger domain protein n=1 Tax=Beauveria brongniartii RCEF 3172 TaxID=1081107 RepID=A0A167ALF3_9HYPO|nr:C6 finger domain protein [Beauveria brongniartii RCEF 3172]
MPPAERDTNEPQVPSESLAAPPSAQRRKRQWATKAKTGCLGCRIRRVRCNEQRPKCASCTKRNMACHYELNPPDVGPSTDNGHLFPVKPHNEGIWFDTFPHQQVGALDERFFNESKGTGRYQRKREEMELATYASAGPWYTESFSAGPVPVWLIPEGWAAFEAVHFCNTVVHRDLVDTDLADSTHRALCRTEPYSPSNDIIVANSLCMRLSHIAGVENTTPKPTPSSVHLWVRLGHLLNTSVKTLSRQITDVENVVENKVLQRICDMTGIEVSHPSASKQQASWAMSVLTLVLSQEYLNLAGGRAHLRGFLAILRLCGIPIDLAKKQTGLGNAIHCMTLCGVLSNTLSSYEAKLDEIGAFSDTELMEMYCFTLENNFPCPSYLWAQILEISKLRTMAATGSSAISLPQHAQKIYEQVEIFSPENWKESYSIPKGRVAFLLSRIFKAAVGIYCCACVPASVVDEDFAAWSSGQVAAQRTTLLRLLGEAVELDRQLNTRILWPIAVAGYAASKGLL